MGQALVGGLLASRWADVTEVVVVESSPAVAEFWAARHPDLVVVAEPPAGGDVLLAVKPQDVATAAEAVRIAGVSRLLSIAAGVTTATLEHLVGAVPVVRAMPNTPALVGAGAAAVAAGRHATAADLDWAEGILSSVGQVVRVPEDELDAVTGLSGSGPAYVFAFLEALAEAGVHVGLAPSVASQLARQTVVGAARLLAETSESPADLRAAVTSKGGTTAAGLAALAAHDLTGAVTAAVEAATRRAGELAAGG